MADTFQTYVIKKEDGSYEMRPERQVQIELALKNLEEAEQYVLRAKVSKYYPCYHNEPAKMVFLNEGEVWKYGYTTKGSRYPQQFLDDAELVYDSQIVGTQKTAQQKKSISCITIHYYLKILRVPTD